MNRYPLWKYLLIITIILVSALYALPNLYPSDPAIQVTSSKGQVFDDQFTQRINLLLKEKKINPKAIEIEAEKVLIRFDQPDVQLVAADALKEKLGKDYIVALNLAPATPNWLRALNADPMYLGLDLRGGVHFLMEVDTSTVLDKNLNPYVRDFKDTLREAKINYKTIIRKDKKYYCQLCRCSHCTTIF
jgi:preprotein translocase subunit SecD